MAGKTDEEIVATREAAIRALEAKGYEVVNTLFTDEWYSQDNMLTRGVEQIPLCFLAKSLENMSLCNVVYFCDGWEKTRGCRLEHEAAKAYGLAILYETQPIGMTFGHAVEAARQGMKIARSGWSGKNQWVVMMPALYLPPFNTQEPCAKVNDRTAKHIGKDTPLDSQPYFALFNAQGKWQPGWVPSTSDCLAEDWTLVD